MSDDIVWQGDVDDDCHVSDWYGLWAHAESMDEDHWYCWVGTRTETLFHSADDDILPLTGAAARRLCELVMRNHGSSNRHQLGGAG